MKTTQKFFNTVIVFAVICIFMISCGHKAEEAKEEIPTIVPVDTSVTGKRIAELSVMIQNDAGNADLYHQRAKLYIQKREMEKAADDIQHVMRLDTTRADYFVTLSDICLAANKPGRAKSETCGIIFYCTAVR